VTMASLVALGAPALPAGHFYRIGSLAMVDGIHVQIRRKRRRWGSRLLMAARPEFWRDGAPVAIERALADAAIEAHQQWTRNDRLAYWTGDHE